MKKLGYPAGNEGNFSVAQSLNVERFQTCGGKQGIHFQCDEMGDFMKDGFG